MSLTDLQRRAVELATDQRVRIAVLTGAPGTGKTFTVRSIVQALDEQQKRVQLAAPTGKAARRMAEQTGREAVTVHRLLEPEKAAKNQDGSPVFAFRRGPDRALDLDVLVVDEASMLDVHLGAALVRALPPHGRLLLVGDRNQLPAVGPGDILGDLLAAGVPAVELTQIMRQDAGEIVRVCHAIRDGAAVKLRNGKHDDLRLHRCDDPEAIRDDMLDLALDVLPRRLPDLQPATFASGVDPLRDIQVIVPTNETGELSCAAFNEAFQARVNPIDPDAGEDASVAAGSSGSERRLRIRAGDKVIQTRNDYEIGAVNGDIGRVLAIDRDKAGQRVLVVGFDDVSAGEQRQVEIPALKHDLRLAYAITCHRAQGSEWPVVLVPCHRQQAFLLTRNWVYTAISRARNLCVIVGQEEELGRAARRTAALRRVTGLRAMVAAARRAGQTGEAA